MLLAIYLLGVLFFASVCAFFMGYNVIDTYDLDDHFMPIVAMIALWPAMLVLAIFLSPVFGLYALGKYFRGRHDS